METLLGIEINQTRFNQPVLRSHEANCLALDFRFHLSGYGARGGCTYQVASIVLTAHGNRLLLGEMRIQTIPIYEKLESEYVIGENKFLSSMHNMSNKLRDVVMMGLRYLFPNRMTQSHVRS